MMSYLTTQSELLLQSAKLSVDTGNIITITRREMGASKKDLCRMRQCIDSSLLALKRAGVAERLDGGFRAEVPPLIILR